MRRRAAVWPAPDVDDFWSGVATEDDEPPERRAPGGLPVSALLLILLAPAAAVEGLRFFGEDGDRYTVAGLALLPFAIPVAALVLLLSLSLRRWLTAVLAVLITVGLVAAVLPRATAHTRPFAAGVTVRVLSVNLRAGQADPARVVDLVRANQVDVLSLQELTPQAVPALDAAGLGALLPNVQFDPRPGAAGSGLASRYPLESRPLLAATTYAQPAAQIDLPGPQKLQVVAVHVVPPVPGGGVRTWQRELAGLPEADVNQPVRLLVGDFNATLDHAALRALLGGGYVDAAAQTGQGLHGTWPADRRSLPLPVSVPVSLPPLMAVDHVIVDHRCPVDGLSVFAVPGSDHRAVFAQFVVPDPTAR